MAAVDTISQTSQQGLLFNVQRFAVHDGPGIRTTAFFKGCPLACSWCHNPEGIRGAFELMLSRDRCLQCGACRGACPLPEGGAAPVGEAWNRAACTACGSCVEVCPTEARHLAGRVWSAAELVETIARDLPFFEVSGGGATFSGGEPLHQPGFLLECLRACRERGIRTAVDTCGHAPSRVVLAVAEVADLVLFDLKLMDPEAHRRHTGVDNRLILDNLRLLSASTGEVWVRLPLVPGVNDDHGNLAETIRFLASLPRRHPVFVLPYHRTGSAKRQRLGGAPPKLPVRPPDEGVIAAFADALAACGFEATLGGSP